MPAPASSFQVLFSGVSMHWKIGGDAARDRLRVFTRRASSILITSSVISLAATGARAEDAAALQRLEAKMQELEARHESEIKTLQAEIRRLRKEKPATAAATQPRGSRTAAVSPPAGEQTASSILPPGLPPPATPAKVLMTYDRGYHF